jgi:bifunctional non-homologous end joining protein LigD
MTNTAQHPRTSLYFRDGAADKEYHAAIQEQGDGFIVRFSYGRCGSTLTHGAKTTHPVPLVEAHLIYQKLVASKITKGYQRQESPAADYMTCSTCGARNGIVNQCGCDPANLPTKAARPLVIATTNEGNDTGIRCQLLNPVEEGFGPLARLFANNTHCLQEKHDGRRVLVCKRGDRITGINRRGLVITLPDAIHQAAAAIPGDFLIDGEAVGETLHAFDLLERRGLWGAANNSTDIRQIGYLGRYRHLLGMLEGFTLRGIIPVITAITPADKLAAYKTFRALDCEGVVFKEIDAPASSGRPNSGGSQLKYKFVESASFVSTGRNGDKRSVGLALHGPVPGGTGLIDVGNVTIPPNHAVPANGQVVEVKYLYAFPGGSVFQPVYGGPRDDIPRADCLMSQLKFKP